ncbi:MAG: hypothetical protein ABI051_03545 [Vicinamibacterales bacterium]
MPRYDLMHWSQRHRDQQTAYAPSVPVPPAASSPSRITKPRSARPKRPRDEDAEHLLRLCHEGRLFDLQAWAQEGKPLTVPFGYRRTLLRAALETGFHSLIEFLLQRENDQSAKDALLRESCWRSQHAVMQLALQYGADVGAVPFQQIIETWDRELVLVFLRNGADPLTNSPFARAFKVRIKGILGIYLDCKRERPDLTEALQEQADIALRQACQDEDLKWVSLLMWLGANPRSKGLTTDDLDGQWGQDALDYRQSALQIACGGRKPEILRRLRPDPATDDLRELMAAAASFITTPETVTYLMSLGAELNDKPDGGSTVLDTCLRHFGWKEAVWDVSYVTYRQPKVPLSKLEKSIAALRSLLKQGARWTPDERVIAETRRALYRVDDDAIVAVIDLLRTQRACGDGAMQALLKAPKMRGIVAAADRRRVRAEREEESARRDASSRRPETKTRRPWLPPSRYNRHRLYEEVWTEPTQQVAQRYGVSDVAIAKACTLLDIPKPPRGYWAKRAAGHAAPARPPARRCQIVIREMRSLARRTACSRSR